MQKSTSSMTRTMTKQPNKVKVVIVGTSGVGKSSISQRFINNQFNPLSPSTLGASFLERVYEHPPGNHYRLQIWDTTGQEKYRSIAKIYYKDAKVAIMVYDVTDSYSLTSLKAWTEEVINCSPKDVILAVVGNKTDMVDLCRKEVEETEGKGYAKSVGAIFHETSAKDNKGLNELFGELCDIVYQKENSIILTNSIHLKSHIIQQKGKRKCCGS